MNRFLRLTGNRAFDQSPKRRATVRPHLEILEDRTVPATLGPEFSPAAVTNGIQSNPDVAAGRNGLYAVAWQHQAATGNSDIRARVVNNSGLVPKITDIVVAASRRNEVDPAVAMDNKGNFVVTWAYNAGGQYNIAAAQFSSTGARRNGRNFTVANQSWSETDPDVAVSGHGHMVITYHRRDHVYARMHNDNRAYVRDISVSTSSRSEHSAKVARSADGRFSVAYVLDINRGDIRLRRYNAAGNLLQRRTIATNELPESDPTISMNQRGDTLVGWLFDFSDPPNQPRDRYYGNRLQARMVYSHGRLGPVRNIEGSICTGIDNIYGPFCEGMIMTPTISLQQTGLDGQFVVSYQQELRDKYLVYDYGEASIIAIGEFGERKRALTVSWSRNSYEALLVWGIAVGDNSGNIAARKLTI